MKSRKEIIAKTRIYNNLLRQVRIEAGYDSCLALGKEVFPDDSKSKQAYVAELENFTRSPTRKRRGNSSDEWTDIALSIAIALEVDPEELWPPEFRKSGRVKAVFKEISLDEARKLTGRSIKELPGSYPTPEEQYDVKEMKTELQKVLGKLTPREERVIRMRFGLNYDGKSEDGKTIEEIGQDFEVTKQRILQIEAKALRKLRHPSRKKRLRDFS